MAEELTARPDDNMKERILFVCIGNICRSPVAEAVAQAVLGEKARVESAGTHALTGNPATSEAVETARELGFDLSTHRARAVADLDLVSYDRIVALTPAIADDLRDRFRVPPERLTVLNVDDPYGSDLDTYRQCASEIGAHVRALFT